MLGMKNQFDISDSIEIHEVDIAGVACSFQDILLTNFKKPKFSKGHNSGKIR